METSNPDKKTFEQLSDKELDDYIATDPTFLANAVEERSYRSSKRLISTLDKMLELAKKLDEQTATLIRLSRAVGLFTVILIILTVGLLAEGGIQLFEFRNHALQPAIKQYQPNQTDKVNQAEQTPK